MSASAGDTTNAHFPVVGRYCSENPDERGPSWLSTVWNLSFVAVSVAYAWEVVDVVAGPLRPAELHPADGVPPAGVRALSGQRPVDVQPDLRRGDVLHTNQVHPLTHHGGARRRDRTVDARRVGVRGR